MDDDPVLASLDAYLEHDDPALAALLSGRRRPHHHMVAWLLLLPLLVPALVLPARFTLGLLAILLVLASPVLVAWLCAGGPAHPDTPA